MSWFKESTEPPPKTDESLKQTREDFLRAKAEVHYLRKTLDATRAELAETQRRLSSYRITDAARNISEVLVEGSEIVIRGRAKP